MQRSFNALWSTRSKWSTVNSTGILGCGDTENNKGASSSMSISSNSTDLTPVIKELHRLHGEGVNLAGIENELQAMKATRKNEVIAMLKGLTGAAVFAKPTSQRFVLGI